MPSRVLLLVTLAAALIVGCGSGAGVRPASSTTDVKELLRDTFSNLDKIKSANVDAKLAIAGGGQAVAARVRGPFESQGAGKLPRFQLSATLESRGRRFSGGATWTGDKGYVTVQGTSYELSGLVARQIEAGYEQALKSSRGKVAGGAILSSLGIDPTAWLKDARNKGDAQAGGVAAIKLTGRADVPRVVDDLQALADKARVLNLPGTAQAPQTLTPQQRRQIIDAVEQTAVEVYTGKADRVLRRVVVTAQVRDPSSKQVSHVSLDLTLNDVGGDQRITAPKDAKPFSALQKLTGGPSHGLGMLGG